MTRLGGFWMVLALVAGCGDNDKVAPDSGPADASTTDLERGRYIMNTLGACTFCHTPLLPDGSRDNTRLLAGVDCFVDIDPTDPNVGCVSSRNLTNHPTGLANATDQQIRDAMRLGKRTDGKTLAPIMPFWVFHNMTDADIDAVVAYLRSVPGVDHQVTPNQQPWAALNEAPPATPIAEEDIPLPMNPTPSAMRGRYLATMAGLCMDCHSPDNIQNNMPQFFPQPIDVTRPFAGGRVFRKEDLGLVAPGFNYPATITVRNLTQHPTGLQGWTIAEIKDAIANGKDRDGKAVCAGTHGSLISPYAALEPQDLNDIATYIASLPPIDNATGTNCEGPTVP